MIADLELERNARQASAATRLKLGFWALADQGAVSAGTFFTNLVLARNLTQEDYGIYALFFSVFLFLNNLHSSLVLYPLSTSPAAGERLRIRRETASALLVTAVVFAPVTAVLAALGLAKASWEMLLAASAAVTGWQVQETFRRGLMAGLRHREAALGDALSYLGQAAIIWALTQSGTREVSYVFWVMAATSAAAALLQALQLGLSRVSMEDVLGFARSAWKLGGWNLAAGGAGVVSVQAYVWALAAFHGPAESGKMLAVLAVLGLSHPLLFSLGNLLTPVAAQSYKGSGKDKIWEKIEQHWKAPAFLAGVYLLFLILLPGSALKILFGVKSHYLSITSEVRIGAFAYLILFLSQKYLCYLAALRQVKTLFLVSITGAFVSVTAGIMLSARFGSVGAMLGFTLTTLSRYLAGQAALRLRASKRPDGASAPTSTLSVKPA